MLIIVVGVVCWGVGALRLRIRLQQLRDGGNETTGMVTDIVPADDGSYLIRYKFDVDGTHHTGEMRAPLRRYADRYIQGDVTPVAYLAAGPDVSVPRAKREIDDSFINWSTGPALLRAIAYAAVMSLVLLVILFRALRQRRLLAEGNIIGGAVTEARPPKIRYEFTTPAGETHGREVRLRRDPPAVGERIDVCWMPRRPAKSRLRRELRYVRIEGE